MVKKGEYIDYAIELEKKAIDYSPSIQPKIDEFCFGTEMMIILEMAKKIKNLEARIQALEARIQVLEK